MLADYGVQSVEGGIYAFAADCSSNYSKDEEIFTHACEKMMKFGANEGHTFTLANDSKHENYRLNVISWSKLTEDSIEAIMRPAGCCGCTIF